LFYIFVLVVDFEKVSKYWTIFSSLLLWNTFYYSGKTIKGKIGVGAKAPSIKQLKQNYVKLFYKMKIKTKL